MIPLPRPAVPIDACVWCGSQDHFVDRFRCCARCAGVAIESDGIDVPTVAEQVQRERRVHAGGPRIVRDALG